jgi:type I restriction enzyme S subunit
MITKPARTAQQKNQRVNSKWPVKELGTIAAFLNGKAFNQKELFGSGKYRILRVGNFFTSSGWYYSDLELEESKYVEDGDLMYAWSASFGPRFWSGEKTIYHYHIWKILPTALVTKKYLFYFLDYDTQRLLNNKQGGTMFHVTKRDMEKRKIPLPPLPEQRKIALILSTCDRAIEKTEQLIAQKQQLKKGLMQQLLTGNLRLVGLGGKWNPLKLSEIGEFSKGSGISKAELVEKGIPCIRYGEIYTVHNTFIKEFHSFINEESAKLSKLIQRGDILFAGSGETAEEIGKCVAFLGNDRAYAGGDIVILRPRSEADSLFLAYQLNNHDSNRQKSSMGKGHSVVHIYPNDLKKIVLKMPSLSEQKLVGKVLKKADYELDKLLKRLDLLKLQKRGLMQQLLTGKVRVKIDKS